jgi:hypothetical protein
LSAFFGIFSNGFWSLQADSVFGGAFGASVSGDKNPVPKLVASITTYSITKNGLVISETEGSFSSENSRVINSF